VLKLKVLWIIILHEFQMLVILQITLMLQQKNMSMTL
jgi:hypothetical protein